MNPQEILENKIHELDLWSKEIVLQRNELLKQSGTIDTNLYFVDSGSLRMYVITENEEHDIRFGYQGNFVAAIDSFLTGVSSDLCIQALKETHLRVIKKLDFTAMIKSSSELQDHWNNVLGALICQQMERERDLLTSSPSERYHRVLKRSPQVFQEIPHKYIASYLRMTPETLSRLKKS